MKNVTEIKFNGWSRGESAALYQYDYGQILTFPELDLPEAYEVHFARQSDPQTITMIGTDDGVNVPDELLLTAGHLKVYIFLHEGENDGETEYKAIIPVIARPELSDLEPTPVQQDVITQAISALNAAVSESSQSASDAAQSAADAAESAASIDMSSFATKEEMTALNGEVVKHSPQALTNAQKVQARANIGAVDAADLQSVRSAASQAQTTAERAVSYYASQTLSDIQKRTARVNIDVPSNADLEQTSYTLNNFIDAIRNGLVDLNSVAIKKTEQTLTDAEKAQARANIGAVSASDIAAEIFWVKYGQTTASEISNALNAGKYPVICEYDSFTWLWTAAPFVYYFDNQFVFESAHGRDFIRYRLTNGVWSTDRIRDYTVKYESQSLSSSEKAQARTNIGAISSADIPVTSVNGQTGAVVIANATVSAAGLMSAADKANLDAVAADYSSALTALGVI